MHSHHSPTNHNGNGVSNGGSVSVGGSIDAYPQMAVDTKKSASKKKRDNNKTLTSGDVKTLERHLSMKKTIRKKIMRDLQQAFVEDPNEFRVENTNSEQLKAEIRAEALRFGGEKHTRKSDNFLDMLRGEKSNNGNEYSATSVQNTEYDYDSPTAPVNTEKQSFWRRFTMKNKTKR